MVEAHARTDDPNRTRLFLLLCIHHTLMTHHIRGHTLYHNACILELSSCDGPLRLETCKRYCVELNYSRRLFGWFYISNERRCQARCCCTWVPVVLLYLVQLRVAWPRGEAPATRLYHTCTRVLFETHYLLFFPHLLDLILFIGYDPKLWFTDHQWSVSLMQVS